MEPDLPIEGLHHTIYGEEASHPAVTLLYKYGKTVVCSTMSLQAMPVIFVRDQDGLLKLPQQFWVIDNHIYYP